VYMKTRIMLADLLNKPLGESFFMTWYRQHLKSTVPNIKATGVQRIECHVRPYIQPLSPAVMLTLAQLYWSHYKKSVKKHKSVYTLD
jgi:hypothetical protein